MFTLPVKALKIFLLFIFLLSIAENVYAKGNIDFPLIPAKTFGNADFNPGASSSFGSITYSSDNSAFATIVNNKVHIVGAGTVNIKATDDSGASITRVLIINKAKQVIDFPAPGVGTLDSSHVALKAKSSSKLTITYKLTLDAGSYFSVIDGYLYYNSVGSTLITASQAGNENYEPAVDVTQSFTVTKSWTKRAEHGGLVRSNAAVFSIGKKIYMVGGKTKNDVLLKDNWEYDPVSDTWAQKADLPGKARWGASAFTIKNKGYVVAGGGRFYGGTNLKDVWQYDADQNTWVQKKDLEGVAREFAFSFVINGKGYIGCGNSIKFYGENDMWAYTPETDSWEKKADFVNTGYVPGAFSIGNNGYVGTYDYKTGFDAFYMYDALTDQWHRKLDIKNQNDQKFYRGSSSIVGGTSLNNKGYFFSNTAEVSYYPCITVLEYDPLSDTFISRPENSKITETYMMFVAADNKAYVIGGSDSFNVTTNAKETWEFDPKTVNVPKYITFNALPEKVYGDADFSPAATISNGGTIGYKSNDTTIAVILNGKIHIKKAGIVGIIAYQTNANYLTSAPVMQQLVINKSPQQITMPALPIKQFLDIDFDPGSSSSSGLKVNYSSSDTSIVKIVDGKLSILGTGTVTITSLQTGNENYLAASTVSAPLTIIKSAQVITFGPIAAAQYKNLGFSLQASSTSKLPITYSVNDPSLATIIGGQVQIKKAGELIIKASQPGNANFFAAEPVSQKLIIYPNDIPDSAWVAKATSPIGNGGVAFTLEDKIYASNGGSQSPNLYEYNPKTNVWKILAELSSTGNREYGVGFGVNGLAYVGTGFENYARPYRLMDFRVYSPQTNRLTISYDFPGLGRQGAIAFSIGGKAYVGLGYMTNLQFSNELYEFDSEKKSWTRKADFPGVSRYEAVAFTIGNKGYVGTGWDGTSYKNDFWEYDPATDKWTQKADFKGGARSGAAGFSIAGKGYIGTGRGIQIIGKDFYEYNPVTDRWKRMPDYSGGDRTNAAGTSINNLGYLGGGGKLSPQVDFWAFNPAEVKKEYQSILFPTLSQKTICDTDFDVNVKATSGLKVTLLSSDTTVATIVDGNKIHLKKAGQTIISASQSGDEDYYSAIVVNNPLTVSSSVSTTVVISAKPNSNIMIGDAVIITATVANAGNITPVYQWLKNGNVVGTNSNIYTDAGLKNDDVVLCQLSNVPLCGNLKLESNSIKFKVVAPMPVITSFTPKIATSGATIEITGGGFLSASDVSFGNIKAASYVVNSSTKITAVIGEGNSGNVTVGTIGGTAILEGFTFVPTPVLTASGNTTFIRGGNVTLTSSTGVGYTYEWYRDGNLIQGATESSYSAAVSGNYQVLVKIGAFKAFSNAIKVEAVFMLPSSNFKISSTAVTCKGNSNGSIQISAEKKLNYVATVKAGANTTQYNFTDLLNINNLTAGAYSICISINEEPGYQQCFDIIITEPKDLALFATVNLQNFTLDLVSTGAKSYQVDLNGKKYTSDGQLTLALSPGINNLSLSSDIACQGTLNRTFNISDGVKIFPNPFDNVLNVAVANDGSPTVNVKLYSMAGILVYQHLYQIGENIALNLQNIAAGVYILKVATAKNTIVTKVIKK
ncbi:T9SS type A sorting domain-containing protein [Pedobacter sp. HDW13]|uniref:Kelch repeat-containing protein n=1 Tax=Pedobacter sp. HDW13 TaxID=2714940 RepID=UPI00140DC299|nr:kelch repeat-containing protein [Pedobacter sp. HDW13]QIL38630.1 T9SS type A sorting domain-containing protein [Pedobacter sp. HDW13]